MRKLVVLALTAACCITVADPFAATVPAAAAAPIQVPKQYETWAWCGVRPSDPTAAVAAAAMATAAGIDATFGPCNVPTNYSAAFTGNRYVDAATYMQLVLINAAAGMKTVVYDPAVWSDDAKVRERAIRFWEPVFQHIQAWDMGDEFNPDLPEWDILIHRWNIVLRDATRRSGILPYTNIVPGSADELLADIPGTDQMLSFDQYNGDQGVSLATSLDSRVVNLMCAVNAYTHHEFVANPITIRSHMGKLAQAGCDSFLVFGGERVYDTDEFGATSLVDTTGAATPWATAVLEGAGTSSYTPVGPARLLDTRPGTATIDGQSAGIGQRPDGTVTTLQVTGRSGVPTTATSATLNVTATAAAAAGFVTVYPCGTRPTAAQLNYVPAVDVATAVIAKLSPAGTICVFNSKATDLVVDVNGFHRAGSSFVPVDPARMLETRAGQQTVDGAFNGVGVRGGGSISRVSIAGRGGVPYGSTAVVLDVTATNPRSDGYVTVFSCPDVVPNASTVNFAIDTTATNAAIVPLDSDGRVCVLTSATIDLVVDVSGYFEPYPNMISLPPSRLMDTRRAPDGTPSATIDGRASGIGTRRGGTVTELVVAGRAGVVQTAAAAAVNLTVVGGLGSGFVTAYPCGAARPDASSINFAPGATVANLVVSEIGDRGSVCLYTSADAEIIVDINDYFP